MIGSRLTCTFSSLCSTKLSALFILIVISNQSAQTRFDQTIATLIKNMRLDMFGQGIRCMGI